MNIRLFSIALLTSALPSLALAHPETTFRHEDFVAVEKLSRDGEVELSVQLSKSGRAKLKKLSAQPKAAKQNLNHG